MWVEGLGSRVPSLQTCVADTRSGLEYPVLQVNTTDTPWLTEVVDASLSTRFTSKTLTSQSVRVLSCHLDKVELQWKFLKPFKASSTKLLIYKKCCLAHHLDCKREFRWRTKESRLHFGKFWLSDQSDCTRSRTCRLCCPRACTLPRWQTWRARQLGAFLGNL